MHEAALANTIAISLRESRQAGVVGRPRLVIRGGHDESAAFDAALRLHLALAAPEFDIDALDIIHAPITRMCSGCGRRYRASDLLAPCPTCGSLGLPTAMDEEVELTWALGKAV